MPELPQLNEILSSGKLSYGRYGIEFEQKLKHFLNVKNLITTNAFSMSIFVALSTLGIKSGDTVIASPMACLASTQPLLSMGVKVLWADVDPKTGTLSPDSVKSLVKYKPKAIIHNHYCGYVGFIDEINSIGKDYNIPVIDDCIEAFGSEYKGRKLGNVGTDVTVFSFGPVRLPNTLDGGAVVFKDEKLYKKSLIIRDSGIDRAKFRDELGEINPECDITMIGYAATMDEMKSYIGIQQMDNIAHLLDVQSNNANCWKNMDLESYGLKQIVNPDANPNYWVFGTLARNKIDAIKAVRETGYYASGVHINNNRYSIFGENQNMPGVNEFYNCFVALPSGWWVDKICL